MADAVTLVQPVFRPAGFHARYGKPAVAACALAIAVAAGLALSWQPQRAGAVQTFAAPKNRLAVPPYAPPLNKLPGLPGVVTKQPETDLRPTDALSLNSAAPFVRMALSPAPPFRFAGSTEDRQRAIECLALAAMAEAGGSDAGQRAVMQVVLNRVRHPAFAKSVCGVVFQGAERSTGCQFTFTCDGSLSRRYSDAGWYAARRRAAEALSGSVFAKVGTATHYHTDWVYPYWSSSLDKIAKVDTHLFFRWKGYWGAPARFQIPYRGGERAMADLVGQAPSGAPAGGSEAAMAKGADRALMASGIVKHPDGGAYLVRYAGQPSAPDALASARRLCGGNGYCRVMGWVDGAAMPKRFPVPPAAREKLTFSYVLDDQNNEIVLYDCRTFSGIARDKCIPPVVRPT